MNAIKKYLAALLLVSAIPLFYMVGKSFITKPSNVIYEFIPQECDFVIEINTRNFVEEILYQRIYAEDYFFEKVYPRDKEGNIEKKMRNYGIDFFEKIILFREQWANESIWIGVLKHTDAGALKSFLQSENPDIVTLVSGDYTIVQLTPSTDQESLNKHLQKISERSIKPFTERVNLSSYFSPDHEINCYIIPQQSSYNTIIDGYFSLEFKTDRIAIDGHCTPITSLNNYRSIAYEIDKTQAISLRTSLNIFNSIYWFSNAEIDDIPDYSQLAFDYNGVVCEMIHRNQGYTTPFKSYPKVQVHFDINDKRIWNQYFDSLKTTPGIEIDSVAETIVSAEGASVRYAFSGNSFELMQDSIQLTPTKVSDRYFDFYLNPDQVLNQTVFTVNAEFPPSQLEQNVGMIVANKMMEQFKTLSTMEWIEFHVDGAASDSLLVSGRMEMKEKGGHSIIETLALGNLLQNFMSGN